MKIYEFMNRKNVKKAALIFVAGLSFLFFSCELGLGSSVDTVRPELEITYPPKGAVIRNDFTIAGKINDDIGVSYIKVELTNKLDKKSVYTYDSRNDKDKKAVTLVPPSGSWKEGTTWYANISKTGLPDGEYFVDVEANDGVDSVYDRRSLRVDNTAPVFIAENLTSLGKETDGDKISTFGRKINLTGKIKDDSEIEKVYFAIYDETGFVYKQEMDYEMTSDGILLAQYNSTDEVLKENFAQFYGLAEIPETNDTKQRYLLVQFADAAREYNQPVFESEDEYNAGRSVGSGSPFDGTGNGNISTDFYLNTQDFGLKNITVDELHEYKKNPSAYESVGTKLDSIKESSIVSVGFDLCDSDLDSVRQVNTQTINKLTIDPKINPKWYVDKYDRYADDTDDKEKKVYFSSAFLGSPLSIMFVKGTDGTQFMASAIRIVLAKLKESTPGVYDTVIASDEELRTQTVSSDNVIVLKDADLISGSTTLYDDYTEVVTLDDPHLKIPNRYRIMVFGKDGATGEGTDFIEKNDDYYGFLATKNAVAPTIEFINGEDTKENSYIGPNTKDFTLNFTVKTAGEDLADGYPKISVSSVDYTGAPVTPVGTFDASAVNISSGRKEETSTYTLSWKLKNSDSSLNIPMPAATGTYKYVFTVEAKDKSEGYSSKSFRINVDKEPPKVTIGDADPYIAGDKINGTVRISADVEEKQGLSKVSYSFAGSAAKTIEGFTGNEKSGTVELDTTTVDDGSKVLKITAEDIFGNTGTTTKTFVVDQASDKPVFTFGNLKDSANASDNKFGLTTGNRINGIVSDDDGVVSKIQVRVSPFTKNDWSDWEDVSEDTNEHTNTVSYEVNKSSKIKEDGKYKIQFQATDSVGTLTTSTNTSSVYNILVDGNAPKFGDTVTVKNKTDGKEISKDGNIYYVKGNVSVAFDITEGNLSSVKVKEGEGTYSGDNITTGFKTGSTTVYEIKYDWTASGDSGEKVLTFAAEDEIGNVKEKVVTLYYDKAAPTVDSLEVSPDYISKSGDPKKYLNGIVKFTGAVSDNDKVSHLNVKAGATVLYDGDSSGFTETFDTTSVSDGELKITFTVTDRAGNVKTDNTTYVYYVDQSTDKPVISLDPEAFNVSYNTVAKVEAGDGKNMLGSSGLISGSVEDDDGVGTVIVTAYKADGTTVVGSKTSSGASFNASISSDLGIENDGAYKIKVEAVDNVDRSSWAEGKKNNGTATPVEFYIVVDGKAPEINNVKINGTAYNDQEAYIQDESTVTFEVVEAHVKSVKVNGTLVSASNGASPFKYSYTYTPENENATDLVKIIVEDVSGLVTTKDLNIYYDTLAPEVPASEVTPSLVENTVNGKITISGSVSDNEGIESLTVTDLTDKDGNKISAVKNGLTYSFANLDTTKFTSDIAFTVTAKDHSGRTTEKTFTYTPDQSKDAPVVSPVSFTENVAEAGVKDGTNLFAVGRTLEAAISDDDGIESVTVKCTGKDDYTPTVSENPLSYTLKYPLPSAEGKYEITITVVDSKKETDYAKRTFNTWIGVSTGAPVVSINKPKVEYVQNGKEVTIPLTFRGGAKSKLMRTVTVTGKDPDTKEVEVTKDNAAHSITDTVKVSAKTDTENAKVTVKYEASNDFGQKNEATYVYYLDNIAPVLPAYWSTDRGTNDVPEGTSGSYQYWDFKVGDSLYQANKWRPDADVKLSGTWVDESTGEISGSGVKEFEYYVVNFSEKPDDDLLNGFNPEGETYKDKILSKGKVNPTVTSSTSGEKRYSLSGTKYGFEDKAFYGFKDGWNYIFFRARDYASNESVFSHFNINIDTTPPELTLNTEAMRLENKVLYVNPETLTGAEGVSVQGTLSDSVSYVNAWHTVALFEGTTLPEIKYGFADNWSDYNSAKSGIEAKTDKWPENMIGLYLNADNPSAQENTKDFSVKIDSSRLKEKDGNFKSSYTITVLGIDYKDNVTTEAFTMYFDNTAPVVSNLEVNKTIEADSRKDNVNGEITVSGNISDDNYIYSTVVEVSGNGKTYTQNVSEAAAAPFVSAGTNGLSQFKYKLNTKDTNYFTDGQEYTVKVISTDRAGNASSGDSAQTTFKVNQATDKPNYSVSNKKVNGAYVLGLSDWIISGMASDDDGIAKIEVALDLGNFAQVYPESGETSDNKTSQVFDYTIPSTTKAGSHTLKVKITDCNATQDTYTVNVISVPFVVDNEYPKFASVTVGGQNYSDGAYVNNSTTVLKLSDDSGIAKLETSTDGTSWDKLADLETSFTHASGNKYYRVTDTYNRVTTKTLNYTVDGTKPTVDNSGIKISAEPNGTGAVQLSTLDANKYFTEANLYISGAENAISDDNLKSATIKIKTGDAETSSNITFGVNNKFENRIYFADGTSKVTLTVTDKAGNENEKTYTVYTVKVDTKVPEASGSLTLTGASDDKVLKGSADGVKITYSASDATSGLKQVYFGRAAGFDLANRYNSGRTYNAASGSEIAVDTSSWSSGSYEIWIRAEDNAGNISNGTKLGSFIIDNDKPRVNVSPLRDAKPSDATKTQVNGTITISGTARDDYMAGSPVANLSIYKDDGTGKKTGSALKTYSNISIDKDSYEWSVKIDTTDSSIDGKACVFEVSVADKFGNTQTESGKFTVDQDTDKPELDFDNINPDGILTLSTTQVSGKITDDDYVENGSTVTQVQKVQYKISAEYKGTTYTKDEWLSATVEGNRWSFSLADPIYGAPSKDAEYTVNFRILENGKTTETTPVYFYKGSKATKTGAFKFKIDSETPKFGTPAITYKTSDTKTFSTEFENFGNNGYYGGLSARYVKFRINVSDAITPIADLNVSVNIDVNIDANNKNFTNEKARKKETQPEYASFDLVDGLWEFTVDFNKALKADPAEDSKAPFSGIAVITFSATDDSDTPESKQYNICIDNGNPDKVTVQTPIGDDEVSGAITMNGTVSDEEDGGSGIVKLEYCIPPRAKKAALPEVSSIADGDWTLAGENEEAKLVSWEFDLSGLTNPAVGKENEINPVYAGHPETFTGSEIYKLPVWFKATDRLGNTGYIKDKYIVFNPNADLPKVVVEEPEVEETQYTVDGVIDGVKIKAATRGGNILISGTAEDNEGIDSVYIQYDVDGDGFDLDDKSWLENVEVDGKKLFTVVTVPNTAGRAETDRWGIKVDGTVSWQTFFNVVPLISQSGYDGDLELGNDKNTTNKTLNFRVCAADNDSAHTPLTSAWSTPVHISVNNSFPTFSTFELVQYSGSIAVKSVPYKKGMFLKGKNWYVEGSVTDNGYISRIETDNSTEVTTIESINFTPATTTKPNANASSGYKFRIPVIPDNLTDAELAALKDTQFRVTAYDEGEGTSQKKNYADFYIQMDNVAPELDTDSNGLKVYKNVTSAGAYQKQLSSSELIQNTNGYTKFISKVTEEGSGFDKAIFYVVRRETKNETKIDRLYNVMEPHGDDNSGNRVNLSDTDESWVDNLPSKTLTVRRPDRYTLTVTYDDTKNIIRNGGVVRIAGNYIVMDTVTRSENNFTITLKSDVDTSYTSASFIYGMVVDNSGETRLSDGTVDKDDGDGMCEKLSKQNSVTTWEAQFDSSTIPDGPLELHVVVFDAAGNCSHGSVATRASNNAPRLTSVKLGTDLTGEGTISDDGIETVQFFARKTDGTKDTSGKQIWNLDTATAPENDFEGQLFTIKNKLDVTPEFVGGTYPFYYALTKAEASAENTTATESNRQTGTTTGNTPSLTKLCDKASESKKISFTNGFDLEDKNVVYKFTFWDSTECSTVGSETGWAVLNVKMKQDTTDTKAPNIVVDRFHWNGLNNNNIYGSSKTDDSGNLVVKSFADLQGHIELEGDLPDALKATGSSNKFTDGPKVSGKITITGSAYDETRLSALYILENGGNFAFGTSTETVGSKAGYKVATFTNGKASAPTGTALDASTPGSWYFQVTKNVLNQYGHYVEWQLDIDTSKIKDKLAMKNFQFKALAKADSANYSESGFTSNGGTSDTDQTAFHGRNKSNYDMDIVPYVTGVETALSDMVTANKTAYSRSALGHYTVRSKSQKITAYTDARQVTSTDETVILTGFNMNSVSVSTSGLSSGYYNSIEVNGVPAINNLNNNDAVGSAAALDVAANGYGVCENYANGYNRQGMSYNKNLTDDIYFDVWEFNNRAALPVNGLLTGIKMKVNPKNGLIQYAFANGGKNFSMGSGTDANGYSSEVWNQDWDTFQPTSVGFHIDSAGNTYATGNGGDTNGSEYPDYFGLMSSSIGKPTNVNSDDNLEYSRGFLILERTAQYNAINTSSRDMDKKRVQSVSMATSANNFYMAYYDNLNDEIRFRAGAKTGLTTAGDGSMFTKLASQTTTAYDTSGAQLIAGKNISGRGASNYVSIGVTSGDTVVVVWYDRSANALKYSYKAAPVTTKNADDKSAKNWKNLAGNDGYETLLSGGGTDCQVAVDAGNHIHIAAHGGSGDLYYIYMESYNSTPHVVLVDSKDTVGGHLTLDVGKDSDGNYIPYIGYFNQSQKKPKYAYLVEPITGKESDKNVVVPAGVDSNECFTGSWEVETVPAESRLIMNTEEKVNMGIRKNDSGVIVNSSSGNCSVDSKNSYRSKTYGNGTKNGVLGYQIANGAGSCLEICQKR